VKPTAKNSQSDEGAVLHGDRADDLFRAGRPQDEIADVAAGRAEVGAPRTWTPDRTSITAGPSIRQPGRCGPDDGALIALAMAAR
jgi:hypothetical protein